MEISSDTNQTPFDLVAQNVGKISSIEIMNLLQKIHLLSDAEAKCILLSSPAFQEDFCRSQIRGRKLRGGKKYGSRAFLRRRFELTEEEADDLIDDFWERDENDVSRAFLSMISARRVAKYQLTDWAQDIVEKALAGN